MHDPRTLPTALFQLANETPNRAAVLARRPYQKKIGEKFDNLFSALGAGKRPSVFTMEAFRVLDAKGRVTQADLRDIFKLEGYTDGTAKSQASQMMRLFQSVGVATQRDDGIQLKKDSKIAKRLRAYL